MLTAGYADEPRLPQTDLVYVAFRLCYFDLLTELDTEAFVGTSDLDEGSYGFLTLVPFFRTVPPTVQLDLLASVWAKHHSPQVQPALLRDAAVLCAIFHDAGRIGLKVWESNLSPVLDDGPRSVSITMDESLDEQWQDMFEDFWDDLDFLSLEEMQDMPPEHAKALRRQFGIPEAWGDEMFGVLDRARASGEILDNLRGLLSDTEIADQRSLLLPETV